MCIYFFPYIQQLSQCLKKIDYKPKFYAVFRIYSISSFMYMWTLLIQSMPRQLKKFISNKLVIITQFFTVVTSVCDYLWYYEFFQFTFVVMLKINVLLSRCSNLLEETVVKRWHGKWCFSQKIQAPTDIFSTGYLA